ncbi:MULTISPECIES: YceI family protein [Dactylosporangium]|uniref:Polyisoprenoid-binding protein n=2 Tax=Dactylosporangium TaxID=35753 RepID=A0A9W6NIP0_9ACTN|nr:MULTISPECIES: YceI family protein [Dactylosporangium]UAB96711.1 polyisoprenoid-binding protein [Dactylosporangium vinaceum]UWZ45039.1 polyisoprenoid-binding protein [Dactylosporangium matsuzakiense]GLK99034.1 polyisoprenoid-binding protein [Dactylosporangium matsuzakiense]
MTAPVNTRDYNGLTIPTAGKFEIDPAHTRVGFVARHMMVSKVRGGFTSASGSIVIAEDPLQSHVDVNIDAASIDTGVADRDGHLRSPDFLNVEQWPHLTFKSTRVLSVSGNEFKVVGDLTIRDVTREVELDVEFEGHAKSPWGQEVIGFSATTEIDREEFGITWNQALETGGVVVGKKVKIEIGAEAVRQA